MKNKVSPAADLFFEHFGLSPVGSDLESLYSIVNAFGNIPYENLTKFLRKTGGADTLIRLPEGVIREHIDYGAGGTCFSLTETIREILCFSEFQSRPVMADMKHGVDIHCAALIELPGGQLYLVDPGYLIPEPVPLEPGRETLVRGCAESMVYVPSADGTCWDMYTVKDGLRQWRYRIKTDQVSDRAFRQFWLDSFYAPGMNSLHMNRRVDGGRVYAHNYNLRITDSRGSRNEKLRDGYADCVSKYFGISSKVASDACRELEKSRCRNR